MTFTVNPNFEADYLRSSDAERLAEEVTQRVAQEAIALAPVGSGDDPHPGEFRESITYEVRDGAGVVYSDDPAAPYIIFGTSDTPAHDTFRRAVEATGGSR